MSEKPPQVTRRVRLNEVIRQTIDFRGRTPLKLGMDWGGEIRALSANNVQMGRINFDREANFGSDSLYRRWMTKGDCERGDILFTTEAPLGNIAQIPDNDRYILSQRVILLKADRSTAEPDYLFHLFQSDGFQAELSRQSSGSTVTGIQQSRFAKIEVELLPLPQQRRIAEILTTVDEAMEQTEALVGKLEQMKAGLMHDLFTRGVTPDGHLRPTRQQAPHLYHQTPLGWLPKEWEIASMNAITSMCIDCPHTTPVLSDDGFLMARTSEIRNGSLRAEDSPRVSPEEYRSRVSRGMPMPGDIIFTREAPVGEAFVIPDDMEICLGQRVMLIRPIRSKCNPHFLLFQIYSSRVRQEFARIVGGTTNPHLNVDDVRRFNVCLPSLDEQALIAGRLSQIANSCAAEDATLAKLRQQKQGLIQDLLTGRVPVEGGGK